VESTNAVCKITFHQTTVPRGPAKAMMSPGHVLSSMTRPFLFEQDVPLSEQLSGVGVEDQFAAVTTALE
jgi:hypothetical protein